MLMLEVSTAMGRVARWHVLMLEVSTAMVRVALMACANAWG